MNSLTFKLKTEKAVTSYEEASSIDIGSKAILSQKKDLR